MFYTLGLKNLPFKQDSRQIIYVESQYDKEINTLIQIHFLDIYYRFDAKGYEFCYLPWQARKLAEGDEGRYFTPYGNNSDSINIKSDFILDYMVHPENRNNIAPSLLYYDPACIRADYAEAETQFFGVTISKDSFELSSDLSLVLDEILQDIDKHRIGTIRFHKVPEEGETDDGILYRMPDDDDDIRFCVGEPDFAPDVDADYLFDTESKVLMDEILERVDKLNQRGINSYIIRRMIESQDDKLSRLVITKDYRIILEDYKGVEINMTPLPKSVFLLFLNHPDGIVFKHLPDYRDELIEIYKQLKGDSFSRTSLSSVDDVTNPLSNSINEKCARIRAAFMKQIDERLAKYYFIDGRRGEPKKISLPRHLVVRE